MRCLLSVVGILFLCQSCVPVRVAPTIEDFRVVKGKRFKRSLSKRQMFVFEDPKKPGHFYDYVNTKFQLNHHNVYDDVPFQAGGKQYFFAFYEVEIPDKVLNFVPGLMNALTNELLNNEDRVEYFAGEDVIRNENGYIAIEVYNDEEGDCLVMDSLSREMVLKYLATLKKEYLATHNYNEVLFKN